MKTINLSKTDTEARNLERLSQVQSMPTLLPAPLSAASSTGLIYCKLYHRFLAHKILYRKRSNKRRSTPLNIRERKDVGVWNAWNDDEGWGWETVSEKEKRELSELGAQVSHMSLTWDQQQFIETHPLGKYACYRPSYLRWSWTMSNEKMGKEDESEPSPDEESLTTGPTETQGLQTIDLTSTSVYFDEVWDPSMPSTSKAQT